MEWAAHEGIVEFTQAYIHEWIRCYTPSSRDDMRLRHVYTSIYSQPPNVKLLDPTPLVSEQLEVIPCNATEPSAVAPYSCAPRSPAFSSESKPFSPEVNMNALEYPDEPEYTLDIRGIDLDGDLGYWSYEKTLLFHFYFLIACLSYLIFYLIKSWSQSQITPIPEPIM
jgi:hypothetical protein